jgi:hypothetical protein
LFEVLEVVSGNKNDRTEREQFYINQYYDNQENCYNLNKNATNSRIGTKNKAPNPLTDKRFRSPTEEHQENKMAGLENFWNSEEGKALKEHRSKFNKASWDNPKDEKRLAHQKQLASIVFKNEAGEEVTNITNLRQFCVERNLSYKAFHMLLNGSVRKSQGWSIL